MQCFQCQKYLPDTIEFCPYCGEAQYLPPAPPPWLQTLRATMLGATLGTVTMFILGVMVVVWWGSQTIYQNYANQSPSPTPQIVMPLPMESASLPTLNLVDYWGGAVQAVAIQDNYLLQGVGAKLTLATTALPDKPIGTLLLPHPIKLLAAQGTNAYLVTADNMFYAVEFSHPTQPQIVKQHKLTATPHKIIVINDYIYLLTDAGIITLEVGQGTTLGRIGLNPTVARDMVVVDLVAYVVGSNSSHTADNLQIWDVSDPSYPTEITLYNDLIQVDAVAVGSDHVYVADRNKGIRILENHLPQRPREVGLDSFMGQVRWMMTKDNTLYVVYGISGEADNLRIVDLSDPTHPTPVGADYRLAGAVTGLAQFDQRLYIAYQTGWQILDLANLAQPYEITPYWLFQPSDLAVLNEYAYVVDNQRGLQAIKLDLNQVVGSYNPPNKAKNILATTNYAYLSSGTTLQIVDITNPVELKPMGAATLTGEPWHMEVVDDLLYTATGRGGLQIINVANPRNPERVAEYANLTEVADVAVAGDYAYLAASKEGLQILDVRDAAYPVRVGQAQIAGQVNKVVVWSHYLGVVVGNRLDWLDITQPYTPTMISSTDFYGRLGAILDVIPSDKQIYIAAYNGLGVVDVSDPTDLKLTAFYQTTTPPLALAINPPYIYLMLSSQGGVMVLR